MAALAGRTNGTAWGTAKARTRGRKRAATRPHCPWTRCRRYHLLQRLKQRHRRLHRPQLRRRHRYRHDRYQRHRHRRHHLPQLAWMASGTGARAISTAAAHARAVSMAAVAVTVTIVSAHYVPAGRARSALPVPNAVVMTLATASAVSTWVGQGSARQTGFREFSIAWSVQTTGSASVHRQPGHSRVSRSAARPSLGSHTAR
jgi:hypothetical protein